MKVSVCIPVYGAEKYIARCARCLFEQTMTDDIEFIFVNDCTPDRSIEILESVLEKYPKRKDQVKIIHHKVNQGVGNARNHAMSVCVGEYIIHCDADDWVDNNLYEKMYQAAVENHADVVCCGIVLETFKKQKKLSFTSQTVSDMFEKYFQTIQFNSLWNKMFLRSIAHSPELKLLDGIIMAEDLLLVAQMLLKCEKMVFCGDVNYHYFCNNSGSLTTNYSKKSFEDARMVMEILIEKLQYPYARLAEVCKGQILFSALRVSDMSSQKIRKLFDRQTCWRVVRNRQLALPKRLIIAVSLLTVPLAKWICRVMVYTAQKIGADK